MSLIYNATFDKNTRKLSFEDRAGNEIYSFTVPERTPAVDDITKPLTFKAKQDGSTVKLVKNGSPSGSFQTSRDGGNTWTDYTINDFITLNIGDKVSFRAKADRTSAQDASNYFCFRMTGKIEAWHNVMSMIRTNDFATYNSVVEGAFFRLFQYCASLTKAPVLPATTLAGSCYFDMFGGCESLIKAPELPATTLAVSCYNGIFYNCSSLTESPVLPATTLADDCYGYMFSGCGRLNEVHCKMPSSYSSSQISSYANNWLRSVSPTGTFYTNADAHWSSGESGIPTGWQRVNEGATDVDDPNKPLMLRAIKDNSSVTLKKNGTLSNTYQTSTNGTDWTDYTLGTKISLNNGEYVYFRCNKHPTTQSDSKYVQFAMTGEIEAWHNAYSMIRPSFTDASASVGNYGMCKLFSGCASLTKAPLLVNALSLYCYRAMFDGCQALTKAPDLPATTMVDNCYENMFGGCSALTKAPELPATILAKHCYSYMFFGCSALTQAPALPATVLAQSCYKSMFYGSPKLNEVRIAATTTATSALENWLYGVSATGDFYCDPNSKIFPKDSPSGIPENWTRKPLADYPTTP